MRVLDQEWFWGQSVESNFRPKLGIFDRSAPVKTVRNLAQNWYCWFAFKIFRIGLWIVGLMSVTSEGPQEWSGLKSEKSDLAPKLGMFDRRVPVETVRNLAQNWNSCFGFKILQIDLWIDWLVSVISEGPQEWFGGQSEKSEFEPKFRIFDRSAPDENVRNLAKNQSRWFGCRLFGIGVWVDGLMWMTYEGPQDWFRGQSDKSNFGPKVGIFTMTK